MHAAPPSFTGLTARRIRVHGLLLAVIIWTAYLWTLATPTLNDRYGHLKGTDFLHFYTLGSLALEHRGADLYNMQAQAMLAQQRVPQAGHLGYVPLYGPQVSLLFAPLAALPYSPALMVWLLVNTLLYALCCYAVWKTCPHLQSEAVTVLILAAAYPAFIHLLAWGQTSALALACFTAAYLALRSRYLFCAGLAIGCLIFKPQLGLAAAAVFLLTLEWRVVAGALVAAAAQLSIGWTYYGSPVLQDYFHHLLHVRDVLPHLEPRPYQMHSLRSFWTSLLPWPNLAFALYLIAAVVVLVLAVRYWKSPAPLALRFSALLLATVLLSPHLTVYDLVIVAPAFLLVADWLTANPTQPKARSLGPLLYICYGLPLLGPLSHWTHIQLSAPIMLPLLWTLYQLRFSNHPVPGLAER
jgi:alpha-1,2-mannosyltransferase